MEQRPPAQRGRLSTNQNRSQRVTSDGDFLNQQTTRTNAIFVRVVISFKLLSHVVTGHRQVLAGSTLSDQVLDDIDVTGLE